jgi:hypothetical protein
MAKGFLDKYPPGSDKFMRELANSKAEASLVRTMVQLGESGVTLQANRRNIMSLDF